MRAVRARFYAALALFIVWLIGLSVLAYTSARRPPAIEPAASVPRS